MIITNIIDKEYILLKEVIWTSSDQPNILFKECAERNFLIRFYYREPHFIAKAWMVVDKYLSSGVEYYGQKSDYPTEEPDFKDPYLKLQLIPILGCANFSGELKHFCSPSEMLMKFELSEYMADNLPWNIDQSDGKHEEILKEFCKENYNYVL